ncbi:MAG: SDR family NAD(P)-dependent oxidoreductase, partial [Dermatophilaceae bacterium]
MTEKFSLQAAHALDSLLDGTVAPGFTRLGLVVRSHLPGWPADPSPESLAGRRVLVTGATSGLGEATALGCLRLGAHVDLVVRNPDKAEDSRGRLLGECPQGSVRIVRCDLSDLDDVRRAVDVLAEDQRPIDALVHNAGSMPPKRTESLQGHELTMSLHVLGPVLMTALLAPHFAADARVVMVTSGGMYGQKLRDDDPDYLTGAYSGVTAYARSKRAQVELLPLLQQRLGAGVHLYATHPGWADTPGVADSLPMFR